MDKVSNIIHSIKRFIFESEKGSEFGNFMAILEFLVQNGHLLVGTQCPN